jgi:hypothetical protein
MFRYEDLSLSYISESLLQINFWKISLYEIHFQRPFKKNRLICKSEKDFLYNTEKNNLHILPLEKLWIFLRFSFRCARCNIKEINDVNTTIFFPHI